MRPNIESGKLSEETQIHNSLNTQVFVPEQQEVILSMKNFADFCADQYSKESSPATTKSCKRELAGAVNQHEAAEKD